MERMGQAIDSLLSGSGAHPQRDKILEAALLAIARHDSQRRRCRDITFGVHPLHVGCILAEYQAPSGVIIAGLLHDIVEDTATTIADLEHRFGRRVAQMVEYVTVQGETWHRRKGEKLQRIRQTNDEEVLMVFCADLISNLQLLHADIAAVGAEKAWSVVGAPPERVFQYYQDCISVIRQRMRSQQGTRLIPELDSRFRALAMYRLPSR